MDGDEEADGSADRLPAGARVTLNSLQATMIRADNRAGLAHGCPALREIALAVTRGTLNPRRLYP